jgi:preprotein translocase subunit SecG
MKKRRFGIMKKRRLFVVVSLFVVITMIMAACGKKEENKSSTAYDSDMKYGGNLDMATSEEQAEAPAAEAAPGVTNFTVTEDKAKGSLSNNSSINVEDSDALQSQDKIIRTFYMDVEAQEFDSLITKMDSEINRLNGYVENSQIRGKSLLDSGGARFASITARVPRENVDEFVNVVGENANVTNKQESTENVTLQYTDMESRKKSLEIEQERLFVLLEKTETLDSIVTLESRLSEIRYELQNYETTLRTYDNKVEYSTVTLSVKEVEKFTPTVEIKQTVGTRIKNGFSGTMYNISEGLKNFLVWFVVNLPYLLIWAVIIIAIALVVTRSMRKRTKGNSTQNPPAPPTPPMNQ